MTTPAGWYPDPSNPGQQIYWNGTEWVGGPWTGPPVAVTAPAPEKENDTGRKTAVAIGVCVLVVIGLVMSMQSVSLLTGSGPIWTGIGFVAAGTAVAFFMRAPMLIRILAAVCLAFALMIGFYMEKQLSDKRNEISQIFNN